MNAVSGTLQVDLGGDKSIYYRVNVKKLDSVSLYGFIFTNQNVSLPEFMLIFATETCQAKYDADTEIL